MKLFLILATAFTLAAAAAGGRSYRTGNHNHHSRQAERDRRANLDYDDIETADQDQVERFDESNDRKVSNRLGVYSTVHSLQVAKNKAAQRRHSKLAAIKDSEAQGTHFEGAHYGTHYGAPQVQQIHTHELLTSQGLVPIYQNQLNQLNQQLNQQNLLSQLQGAPGGGNIVLTGGLGVTGLGDAGHHHGHGPLIVTGGGGAAPPHQLIAANPGVGPGPGVENDLGTDITKSVYVFSAPPDPFDYVPRPTLSKIPQRPQKHYQVLFINAPSPPPPQQHHVELPPPPELKTLVYVLVKKPQPPPPINFIKGPPGPHHHHKPEVYFIRYKNRGYGLSPSPVGPIEDGGGGVLPVGHPGAVQYAPLSPQEELRGNIDYGPALQPQYEAVPQHHPYQLDEYQDDSHLAASQVLSQRSPGREVDAGVAGI